MVTTTQSADAALSTDTPPPAASVSCAAATWSYSWNSAASVATITAAGGAPGQAVCSPLYVRAASWNYDTPVTSTTPSWPQTLKAKNDYTLSTIGTHTVAAPGTECGQDDIYATFNPYGFQALQIATVLTAPGVPKEPSFLHSVMTGTGGSTWHIDSPAVCTTGLEITKTAVASGTTTAISSVDPGGAFDYTIAVRNSGANHATGVVVTDTIPASLTIAGPMTGTGWTCSTTGQSISCAYATQLNAGASAALIRVPVKLTTGTDTSVLNRATACATNVVGCVGSEATISVIRPGISIDKTASVSEVQAGDSFTYSLVVSNSGTATATGVTVSDTLDANLKVNGSLTEPAGWDCTWGTGWGADIDCAPTSGTVAAGAVVTIVVPVSVTGDVAGTSIPNTAEVCSTNTSPACDTGTVTVPVKSITLLVDSVCTNDVPYLHYVITTTNDDLALNPQVTIEWAPATGPVEAWATTLLPSASTLEGYLIWPGAAVDADGNATDWPGWTLVGGEWVYDQTAPGANLRENPRITASINPTTTVTVSYPDQVSGCANPETPGLAIAKTTDATTVVPGEAFAYAITVTNPGNAPATDVVVTDALEPQLALTAVPTASGWTCTGPVGAPGATFTCTKSSPLLVTDTADITVPVTVIDGLALETASLTIPNTAKVCASNVHDESASSVEGCPTSTVSVQLGDDLAVLAPAGLDILKTASVTMTAPGGNFSYTVLVSNTDFGDTLDVVVTDTLDPRLKLTAVPSGTDWSCLITDTGTDGFGATFECTLLAPLVNGAPKAITVPVVVDTSADPETSRTIPNTAEVCASNVLDCVQSSASVGFFSADRFLDAELVTLALTGREALGLGAIALGALGLGLGLVLLGLTRRIRKQTR